MQKNGKNVLIWHYREIAISWVLLAGKTNTNIDSRDKGAGSRTKGDHTRAGAPHEAIRNDREDRI